MKIDWFAISKEHISENFIREHKEVLAWELIATYQKMTDDFLEEMKEYVDWTTLSWNKILSEKTIARFQEYVSWPDIYASQTLSEPFMEKCIDHIDWNLISYHQILSERFIETYKDHLNWEFLSQKQHLSYSFIKKYIHLLPLYHIEKNEKIILSAEELTEVEKAYISHWEPFLSFSWHPHEKGCIFMRIDKQKFPSFKEHANITLSYELDQETNTIILDISCIHRGQVVLQSSISKLFSLYADKPLFATMLNSFFKQEGIIKENVFFTDLEEQHLPF